MAHVLKIIFIFNCFKILFGPLDLQMFFFFSVIYLPLNIIVNFYKPWQWGVLLAVEEIFFKWDLTDVDYFYRNIYCGKA